MSPKRLLVPLTALLMALATSTTPNSAQAADYDDYVGGSFTVGYYPFELLEGEWPWRTITFEMWGQTVTSELKLKATLKEDILYFHALSVTSPEDGYLYCIHRVKGPDGTYDRIWNQDYGGFRMTLDPDNNGQTIQMGYATLTRTGVDELGEITGDLSRKKVQIMSWDNAVIATMNWVDREHNIEVKTKLYKHGGFNRRVFYPWPWSLLNNFRGLRYGWWSQDVYQMVSSTGQTVAQDTTPFASDIPFIDGKTKFEYERSYAYHAGYGPSAYQTVGESAACVIVSLYGAMPDVDSSGEPTPSDATYLGYPVCSYIVQLLSDPRPAKGVKKARIWVNVNPGFTEYWQYRGEHEITDEWTPVWGEYIHRHSIEAHWRDTTTRYSYLLLQRGTEGRVHLSPAIWNKTED